MSTWAAVLDEILPPTGIDLGILRDPAALQEAATAAMRNTGARINAPATDVDLVLDALFGTETS